MNQHVINAQGKVVWIVEDPEYVNSYVIPLGFFGTKLPSLQEFQRQVSSHTNSGTDESKRVKGYAPEKYIVASNEFMSILEKEQIHPLEYSQWTFESPAFCIMSDVME